MGRVDFKRPVVLVVEDEFLLRMDAVDMIAGVGFEVVEADSGKAPGHHRGFHRHPDAGLDGRAEARPRRSRPLAADQDRRDLRPRRRAGNGFACRRPIFAQAVQPVAGDVGAARIDRRRLMMCNGASGVGVLHAPGMTEATR